MSFLLKKKFVAVIVCLPGILLSVVHEKSQLRRRFVHSMIPFFIQKIRNVFYNLKH